MHRLRESFIVRETESQDLLSILTARSFVYGSGQGMVLPGDKDNKIPMAYFKAASSAVERMIEVLMPWEDLGPKHRNDKSRTIEIAEQLTKAWEAKFGKIDSPKNLEIYRKLRENHKADGRHLKEKTRDSIQY